MLHVSYFKDTICRNEINGKELTTDLEKFSLQRVTVRICFELPSYFGDFSFCYSNSISSYSVHRKFPCCPSFRGFYFNSCYLPLSNISSIPSLRRREGRDEIEIRQKYSMCFCLQGSSEKLLLKEGTILCHAWYCTLSSSAF